MGLAEQIRDRVSMPMLLERYGFPINNKRRISCPIHNGKNNNFAYNEHSFICFKCNKKGDIITFVMEYFNINFEQALTKIDYDFNLMLKGKRMSIREQNRIKKIQAEKAREKEVEENIRQTKENDLKEHINEFRRLWKNKIKYAPKNMSEEWHELFVEALQKLEILQYKIEKGVNELYV